MILLLMVFLILFWLPIFDLILRLTEGGPNRKPGHFKKALFGWFCKDVFGYCLGFVAFVVLAIIGL